MDISWKKIKDREFVEKYAVSNPITARIMINIAAAKDFLDIVRPSGGRAHFLTGVLANYFGIDLEKKGNGKRLICKPTGNFQIVKGQYVKESITEFEVVDIDDYHKKK